MMKNNEQYEKTFTYACEQLGECLRDLKRQLLVAIAPLCIPAIEFLDKWLKIANGEDEGK